MVPKLLRGPLGLPGYLELGVLYKVGGLGGWWVGSVAAWPPAHHMWGCLQEG